MGRYQSEIIYSESPSIPPVLRMRFKRMAWAKALVGGGKAETHALPDSSLGRSARQMLKGSRELPNDHVAVNPGPWL